MRIGISVAQSGRLARPPAVAAAVRAAEQLGYCSVWMCDSLLDPAGALSAAAAAASTVRLGTALVVRPGQDPGALARALARVDVLTDAPLAVALGVAPGDPGRRLERVLEAIDSCWPHGDRPLTLLDGAPELVARRADGWSPSGLPVDDLAPMWATLRALAAGHGRDPDDMQLVVRAGIVLTSSPAGAGRPSYHGDADQVADDVERTRRIGADEVVLRLDGDLSLDEALDGYARIAEAAELREAQRA